MSVLKESQHHRRRKSDKPELELVLDNLSRQLCSPEELSVHLSRQEMIARKGMNRVKLFPVWRRHRWQAQKIARLQEVFPFLKRLPLKVSVFLSDLVYS